MTRMPRKWKKSGFFVFSSLRPPEIMAYLVLVIFMKYILYIFTPSKVFGIKLVISLKKLFLTCRNSIFGSFLDKNVNHPRSPGPEDAILAFLCCFYTNVWFEMWRKSGEPIFALPEAFFYTPNSNFCALFWYPFCTQL